MANCKLLSWLLHVWNDKNVKTFNQNSKVSLMRFKLGTPKYKHHHFTAVSFSSTSSYNYLQYESILQAECPAKQVEACTQLSLVHMLRAAFTAVPKYYQYKLHRELIT